MGICGPFPPHRMEFLVMAFLCGVVMGYIWLMLTDDAVCDRFSSSIRIASYSYTYTYSSFGSYGLRYLAPKSNNSTNSSYLSNRSLILTRGMLYDEGMGLNHETCSSLML